MPWRAFIAALLVLVLLGGCAAPQRTYTEGILAEDCKLMTKAELIRYLDRLEGEMVRVGAGGTAPGALSRDVYLSDLRQRMTDVQNEIGLRNIWERKSYGERRELNRPSR